MTRFSFVEVIKGALTGQKNWTPQWPDAQPKTAYDVVIVGAGGHGLGAAYYLAKEHGITNIAVIDKGWLGGGNTGRNTTIIRSNYLYDESARLYDHALDLWEDLSQELNYNVMYSKRGVMMLAHNVHDVQSFQRHVHSNRLNGVDNQWLSAKEAKLFCPPLDISPSARYPVLGAALQRRAGTARHDAVAWGYARGAAARGVDIIQNCPVTAIRRGPDGSITGVETAKGFITAKKVAVSAAGHTSVVMETAGVRLPLIEHTLAAICEIFPIFRRMRMLRKWGGIVDVTPDRSAILGKTPVSGLYVNCGWGTGGFKATPGAAHMLAWTVAKDEPHPINAPFTLERFTTGRLIDEAAAAAVAH